VTEQTIVHRADEPIAFRCNICDGANTIMLERLTRDDPSCARCGSSVRLRSVIQMLTCELFGRSLSISEIRPAHRQIIGVGLSCADVYASRLARRLGYTNTFYHREPLLDITNIDSHTGMEGTLDFLISTDVFEHIQSPVSAAFVNARKLLKPDGVFIFSVPFSDPGKPEVPTDEHFPELHDYSIERTNDRYRLQNTTRGGDVQIFDNLVFHGGPGTTLEMRVFSEASLLRELNDAGFCDVTFYDGADLGHGIHWADPWSIPLVARVGKRSGSTYPRIRRCARLGLKKPLSARCLERIRRLVRKIRADR
jgi:SAM-dependent methyltransferase